MAMIKAGNRTVMMELGILPRHITGLMYYRETRDREEHTIKLFPFSPDRR